MIVPADAVHVTVELYEPVPATVAEQVEAPLTLTLVGEHTAETEVIVDEAPVIAMVVVADLVVFCAEVAVIVTEPPDGTVDGAVNTPLDEIVPAEAVHVTTELYEPVPATVEEQEELPLTLTLVGEHDAVTPVTVDEPPMVTTAVAVLVGSCCEVAVIVA